VECRRSGQSLESRSGYYSPGRGYGGAIPVTLANEAALRTALEAAGVEFIDENGGGPGVRLRKLPKQKR
jgi:hypothetical protein